MDRDRADGDDLVLAGIEPGELEIDRAPVGLAPGRLGRRRWRAGERARRRLSLRRHGQPHCPQLAGHGADGPEHAAQVVPRQGAHRARDRADRRAPAPAASCWSWWTICSSSASSKASARLVACSSPSTPAAAADAQPLGGRRLLAARHRRGPAPERPRSARSPRSGCRGGRCALPSWRRTAPSSKPVGGLSKKARAARASSRRGRAAGRRPPAAAARACPTARDDRRAPTARAHRRRRRPASRRRRGPRSAARSRRRPAPGPASAAIPAVAAR